MADKNKKDSQESETQVVMHPLFIISIILLLYYVQVPAVVYVPCHVI